VACQLDTSNNQPESETIVTHRYYFEQLLAKTQPELVVMETCSITGWVHDLCRSMGCRVLVANPSQEAWRWKNVKRKTDKDDSLKLAKLTALDQIVAVHVPTSEERQYRHLVKYRKVLVGRVNTVQNNIRALFDQQGIHIPVGHRAWTVAGIEELSRYRKSLAECHKQEFWQGELDLELTALAQLWKQLAQVDERLEQESKQDERVQLLMTIPGVGRRTAEVIVTCLDRPKRFKDVRQVSSYAGLVPKQHQSGQTNRIGAITRRGSRLLRTALVEVA
jgi:transposase